MTLRELFNDWCRSRGYFSEGIHYKHTSKPLDAQCAQLLRMDPDAHVTGYSVQTYVLEARFGSTVLFPFGQERRDHDTMTRLLRRALERDVG